MGKPGFNLFGTIRDLQERVQFVMNADKQIAEIVSVLKDTHRILAKLETVVDKLDESTSGLVDNFDPGRIERIEQAVFNIERATLGLESTLAILPKRWRRKMEKARQETSQAP